MASVGNISIGKARLSTIRTPIYYIDPTTELRPVILITQEKKTQTIYKPQQSFESQTQRKRVTWVNLDPKSIHLVFLSSSRLSPNVNPCTLPRPTNVITHGYESKNVREQRGKRTQGTLTISDVCDQAFDRGDKAA